MLLISVKLLLIKILTINKILQTLILRRSLFNYSFTALKLTILTIN